MRDRLRRLVSRLLLLIPSRPVEALRRAHAAAVPGTLRQRTLRPAIEVLRYRGIPRGVEEFALLDNPAVRVRSADSFIAERLYWFGEVNGYEGPGIRWWKSYATTATGVLDLGANVGYYALQAATVTGPIPYVAVEPHPRTAEVLRHNLAANAIEHVRVVEAAALPAGEDTTIDLRLPVSRDHYEEAPCSPFVTLDGRLPDIGMGTSFDYSTITVAAVPVLSLLEPGMNLVKIDVEGFELELLRALEDHVVAVRPTIFVELLDSSGPLRGWIAERLTPLGYRCFVPRADRLDELDLDVLASSTVESRGGERDVILSTGAPGESAARDTMT